MHLFVYGTLRSGCDNPHARLLAANARLVGNARVRGRLRNVGPYKAVELAGSGDDWVAGELHALRDASILRELDLYEGSAYRRVITTATLDDGGQHETWIYEYAGPA